MILLFSSRTRAVLQTVPSHNLLTCGTLGILMRMLLTRIHLLFRTRSTNILLRAIITCSSLLLLMRVVYPSSLSLLQLMVHCPGRSLALAGVVNNAATTRFRLLIILLLILEMLLRWRSIGTMPMIQLTKQQFYIQCLERLTRIHTLNSSRRLANRIT